MKTSILSLFIAFLTLTSLAHAKDACNEALNQHIDLIERSDAFFEDLGNHTKTISPFEITQMQKILTQRNQSLKAFQAMYEEESKAGCLPKVLATAVAIYDYSRIGKTLFAIPSLRRIVLGFSKYTRYQLTDLVKNYKKYTKNKLIERTINDIEVSKIELPENVIFHKSQHGYDPHLYAISDVAIKGTTSVVAGAARIWGFISDQLKWRQGRLRANMEARELVRSNLRPLDLVYETRNYTLSNFTIPGHWGHVGVWLGTKEELEEMGVWDQDYFKPFRSFVEAGQNIVEIRKEGLNFQSLESFINLDEIAITRVKNIEERALTVYSELSEQIDKKYDFKFDARSADKITCAELIAFSYGDIPWPVTKTMFQYSLRPDDLAILTLEPTSPTEFVLYLKGKKGGTYEDLGFDGWKKLFKLKNHISAEEKAKIDLEKEEKEEQES